MTEIIKTGKEIDKESFQKFVDEFKNESDRAAVVLGAAKLDLLLYQIIQAYLLPVTTGRDELLDGDSPLGTFSSKISFVYRTGLVDSHFAKALHLIRKIRNAFAHEVSGCSLTNGAHADRVKELVLPFKHLKYYNDFREHFFGIKAGSDIDFRSCLAIMAGRLEICLLHTETVARNPLVTLMRDKWK